MGPVTTTADVHPIGYPIAVYLLHFDKPIHGRRHYIGSCQANQLQTRMRRHQLGTGSNFTRRMHEAGSGFTVARVWYGPSRSLEKKLKLQSHDKEKCPICAKNESVPLMFTNVLYFPPIAPKSGTCVLSWDGQSKK